VLGLETCMDLCHSSRALSMDLREAAERVLESRQP